MVIVGLVGVVAFCVGCWGLVRGRVGWARITSRKVAGVVIAASLVGMGVAGAMTPEPQSKSKVSAAAADTTSTVESTTTTVELTMLPPIVASPTTTTAKPTTTTTAALTATTARVTTTTAKRITTTAAPRSVCSASVSDPHPTTNEHEHVNVSSNLPNSSINVTVHYKTTTSQYTGGTDGTGAGDVSFSISHATSDYTVAVDIVVGAKASCSTSFTPA